ncbi:uncharacterized protein LODBEIA_P13800 [Lodderomyces beijingensis]|uniref:Karyogamy protein n=1 Tax=Lodderomyces beijingensis TaxID=1775926 RepID=A0ABP0ZJW0_9ASCO
MNPSTVRPPTLKLSHLLASIPNFSFFNELISIAEPGGPNSISLSQHDIFKINKILDDIDLYLNDLIMVFNNVQDVSTNAPNLLEWYFEGRNALAEVLRNLESVDSIISRLLLVVEAADSTSQISSNLLRKFEENSDLLLDVKKSSIVLKKNLDVSGIYNELMQMVICSLRNEIEDCIRSVVILKDFKLTSPKRVLPQFNLADIVSKMKIHDFSSSAKVKSMRLPTFSDLDEKLYEDYLSIEEKISPLQISLNIVPQKIEEFNAICLQSSFQACREKVLENYEEMLDKWKHLQAQMSILKVENIDAKWNQIFTYLIDQIEAQCNELIDDLAFSDTTSTGPNSVVSEDVGVRYKVCANSVQLIQNAIREGIITDKNLSVKLYRQLQPKWIEVNDLITRTKVDPNCFKRHQNEEKRNGNGSNGLRSFRTRSKESDSSTRPVSNGLGVDLNVDVESVTLPLSVQKRDRTVDVFVDHAEKSPGKSLKKSLIQVFDNMNVRDKEDEEETLVKTPVQPKVPDKRRPISFDMNGYIQSVLNSNVRKPSKIPRIHPNYIQLGYPIIAKRKGYTRIPEINPSHPVFHSPYRLKNGARNSSPNPSPHYHRRNDPFHITRSRQSSTATIIGRPNSLLNEMKIPNLAYSRILSYNCTSPERPMSSLGSRYDDENLLKTLNEARPLWKG